jgi:hypothetical protein
MKQGDKPHGKCQWDECEREATKYRYRSVSGKKLKDPVTKKRIWFESCFVCDECEKYASREYDQFSFVAPYQK